MNNHLFCLLGSLLVSGAAFAQSLTAEQCVARALQHNAAIGKASNEVESARRQKQEAFTNYFPQVSAVGGTFRSNKEMFAADIDAASLLPSSLVGSLPASVLTALAEPLSIAAVKSGTVAGVAAVQPVFAGGRIVNGNRLAAEGVAVSRLQERQAQDEVRLTTERYFWQVVTLKEKLRTVQTVEATLDRLETDVARSVEAGITRRNDLLQIRLRRNSVATDKAKLLNAIALSRQVLAQYIGLGGSDTFDVVAPDTAGAIVAPSSALRVDHAEALPQTTAYQLLQANVRVQRLQKRIETGQHLPTVSVGAGYSYYHLSGLNRSFGTVFATVSLPISSWWGGSHAIRRRKLQVMNAESDARDGGELLQLRMQKVWNELDDAYRQMQLARQSVEQSEENLRLHTDFYRAGTTTMSNLLEAQALYRQACHDYTDAFAQYRIKACEYRQSTGR